MRMAKFLTITQTGFTFCVHDADKMVADEEWEIERVAAFISVHHVLNIMVTKYSKNMTYRTSIAAIQYTLKCDPETSKDLNRLNQYLVATLIGIYQNPEQQGLLGRPLSTVLDDVEIMAKDYVHSKEVPITVFGNVVAPEPFYTRPTKQVYDAILEREKAQEQRYWDKLNELVAKGMARGHKLLIKEGTNTYTGIIVSTSAKCIYCDVKDEYGRLVQSNARFPKDSKRFIIESLN